MNDVAVSLAQKATAASYQLERVVPLYVAAIAGAAASIAFGSVALGVTLDAVVVVVALNHYLLLTERGASKDVFFSAPDVLLALPLVPILQISAVTMTVRGLPRLSEYALVGLPVLVAAACVLAALRPSRLLVDAWAWSREQTWVAVSGLPLGLIAFLIYRPHPLGHHPSVARILLGAVVLAVFVAFLEEFVFRGVLQAVLTRLYGRGGPLWGSLLFAVAYLGVRPVTYVPFAAVVGLFFAWVVDRTGSLAGIVGSHALLLIGSSLVWPRVLG